MRSTADEPAAARRGRPRSPVTDRAILRTTFRQLMELGYAGMSIESVAAEAGVAKTTIYRRYPGKRDLVVAALGEAVPFAGSPPALSGRDAIAWFVRQAIASLVDSGAVRILGSLLVEARREPELLDVFRARIIGPRRELVDEMLRRGVERGEIRPDVDPLVVAEMVAGSVIGHHLILGLPATDEWVSRLVDHVWAAIRAE